MATQKPISTISYNSESFLREKLEIWVEAHIIQSYQYIFHVGEDGDKNHFHVRVEPNKRIDPMDLAHDLREFVPGNAKPLGVRPWRPSKEEDWFLYAVHDHQYLQLKYRGGEDHEKIPYDFHQIIVPDDYDLEAAFVRAKSSMLHSTGSIAVRMQAGSSPLSLMMEGENPFVINQISHLLQSNDYGRLAEENNKLKDDLLAIHQAIADAGLTLEFVDDKPVIRFLNFTKIIGGSIDAS